ncbi:MFS transporter [Amycolatopsis sp. CA-230715]|uniref:MFS transporter n=1 Tax=Amycolatopsis sp. CA-230715 TaxID=2745196 RepID=UPI001C01AF55|nr:MFS transporter [Amycolatopsis sp. CA-230715]QWF83387.1 Multidrug resistance protein Stp [Amycolatopsis sp. CA-230715]
MTTTRRRETPPRPWLALIVLASAVGLDVMGIAVVNTALPVIGADLGMGDGALPWVMTLYAVAFAGFLLPGGRLADVLGRRRVFVAGVAIYAVGSAGAAAAPTGALLLIARLLQGTGAAVCGPPALALIPEVFPDPARRAKAVSVYTAVGAGSFGGGLVLGGVLTELAGWRSVFGVLAAVALLVTAVAPVLLPPAPQLPRQSLDLPGGLLVSTGLIALVLGVGSTLVFVLIGLVLLTGFVVRERMAREPLLPLAILTGAPVRAATAAGLVFFTALNGLLYFAPLYLQNVLSYSPMASGLAIVPMSATVILSARAAAALLPKVGMRWLLTGGLLLMTVGVATWLMTGTGTGYWTGLLPGIVLMSVGQGFVFTTMTVASLTGVAPERHGVAGAFNITMQQIGAGLGVAVVTAIAAAATTPGVGGSITGYHAGIGAAAAAALLGAIATAYTLRRRTNER